MICASLMDVQTFLETVPDLTDLELAVLLCLVAQQHCLITTEDELLDDLAAELALIVSEVFSLSYKVVSREDLVSVEKFGEAILSHDHFASSSTADDEEQLAHHSLLAKVNFRTGSRGGTERDLDTRLVVSVIIAKDFNLAPQEVQVAALELMRNRRIYSRTTVHPVPKIFLFLPLISISARNIRLNHHLNDHIFISHYHDPEDGFVNLEDLENYTVSDRHSGYSTPKSTPSENSKQDQRIPHRVIDQLRSLGDAASITIEIRRYIQDIVVFLRMERAVDGGITPFATTMFVALCKHLAALHGIDFVTPDLVSLAAKKIYPHRIVVSTPERERSMQYGSDLETINELLEGLTPDDIVEHVLNIVPCPV